MSKYYCVLKSQVLALKILYSTRLELRSDTKMLVYLVALKK